MGLLSRGPELGTAPVRGAVVATLAVRKGQGRQLPYPASVCSRCVFASSLCACATTMLCMCYDLICSCFSKLCEKVKPELNRVADSEHY